MNIISKMFINAVVSQYLKGYHVDRLRRILPLVKKEASIAKQKQETLDIIISGFDDIRTSYPSISHLYQAVRYRVHHYQDLEHFTHDPYKAEYQDRNALDYFTVYEGSYLIQVDSVLDLINQITLLLQDISQEENPAKRAIKERLSHDVLRDSQMTLCHFLRSYISK